MEQSIENIWKKGFLAKDAMVAPQVNDLYNQKSKHLIEKIRGLFRSNIIMLYGFAALMVVFTFIFGLPYLFGGFLVLMFVVPAIYSQKKYKNKQTIDQHLSMYEYLSQFDEWLKAELKFNTTLARFYYPLALIGASGIVWFTDGREEVMNKILEAYPNLPMVGEMPLYFVLAIIVIGFLISLFAGRLYRLDVRLIYGRAFDKLEELIKDLEELRS